jgi:hypothetical protein
MELLKKKSLVAIVENSIKGGDNYTYRNLFFREKGEVIDILDNGHNSCAVFVSHILLPFELIKKAHATVSGAEEDLKSSGWYKLEDLKIGAVLVWASFLTPGDDEPHKHIGFYVGNKLAISNSSTKRIPHKHHFTYNNARDIEAIYWHPVLD